MPIVRYQRLSAVLSLGSRGNALRSQVDVQNSFCIYIWHPVQQTGWFFMNTIMNTSMNTFMNRIMNTPVNDIVNRIMNTIVNTGMEAFGMRCCTRSGAELRLVSALVSAKNELKDGFSIPLMTMPMSLACLPRSK
jgi:hypothetical protein